MNQPTPPIFDSRDTKRCLAFIATLPITHPAQAQALLPDFLAAIRASPPPPADYLEVMEMLRSPLSFIQGEVAKQFASKALPFGSVEEAAYQRVVALWKAMAKAYAQIAQLGGGDPVIQADLAKICQRCLHYSGLVLVEHYRARRAFEPGVWIELHGYFETAEDWGIATSAVPEPLGAASRTTSCAHTYATTLLMDLANPYARDSCQFAWISLWAQRFARLTRLVAVPEDEGCKGYAVDLMLDQGLRPVEIVDATPSARVFDTSRLGPELQQVLAMLKQGRSPASLGLGDECLQHEANRLLLQLYRPWCLAALPRRYQRSRCSGNLSCCFGIEAIHYFVSGKEFVQPEHVRMFSRADMDSLWTFRSQVDPTQPLHQNAARLGYALESWEVVDSSLNGYRLTRGSAGARIEHGGLFCLKAPGAAQFQLARISWLMQQNDGSLLAGLMLMPGIPEPMAVRPTGPGVSTSEKYTRAFRLGAAPSVKEPATLFVPRGWFYPDRVIEVYAGQQVGVRLTGLLDQGSDFERVSYTGA
jgi:hypothetical protein